MFSLVWICSAVAALVLNSLGSFADGLTFRRLCLRSPAAIAVENLFLRKQFSLYIERKTKPRRATNSVRFTLARLSGFFDWSNALTIVKPDTVIRWHRKGFRLFWKWKSRSPGRPRIPAELQNLIREIAVNNPTFCGRSEAMSGWPSACERRSPRGNHLRRQSRRVWWNQ